MTEIHPAAIHHLPSFVTPPGETDLLMVVMSVTLAFSVVMFGILYLRLHSLPERMAHRTHKLQLEIVAVLGLISLFTHMHIFWIIGLLLAMVELPDFGTSLNRIAGSAEKIAGIPPPAGAPPAEASADTSHGDETAQAKSPTHAGPVQVEGVIPLPTKPEIAPPKQKELIRA